MEGKFLPSPPQPRPKAPGPGVAGERGRGRALSARPVLNGSGPAPQTMARRDAAVTAAQGAGRLPPPPPKSVRSPCQSVQQLGKLLLVSTSPI